MSRCPTAARRRSLPRPAMLVVLSATLALLWIVGLASAEPPSHGENEALQRAVAFNLAQPDLMSQTAFDSLLLAEQHLPVPVRIGHWARRYRQAPQTEYRFGLAAGGYVDKGLLVPGLVHDCISFVYRTSELARARDARDAIQLALALRFAGATFAEVVGSDGRVDYDHPSHLDYSLDMIRSGHWGRDVTATFVGAVLDTVGSARFEPGSFLYLPTAALAEAAPAAAAVAGSTLQEGDLVWLVLDARNPRALALRREHGIVIGHAGVLVLEDGEIWLIHAASRPLTPWYDRAGVVGVPLLEYLRRVERYGGIVVTRLDDRAG